MNGNGQPTGIISKILAWITHASYTDTQPVDWFAFFVVFGLLGYLWSKIVRQVLEAA